MNAKLFANILSWLVFFSAVLLLLSVLFSALIPPFFFPEKGSCAVSFSDEGVDGSGSRIIDLSADPGSRPVFMFMPYTLSVQTSGGTANLSSSVVYATYSDVFGKTETLQYRLTPADVTDQNRTVRFPSFRRGKHLTAVDGRLYVDTGDESFFTVLATVRTTDVKNRYYVLPFLSVQTESKYGGVLGQNYGWYETQRFEGDPVFGS